MAMGGDFLMATRNETSRLILELGSAGPVAVSGRPLRFAVASERADNDVCCVSPKIVDSSRCFARLDGQREAVARGKEAAATSGGFD